jgi:DNA invertase Pin-like site-specific DNA recombinase
LPGTAASRPRTSRTRPSPSPPSDRSARPKVAELGGRIVCEFTDQETGRRDDRIGWSELLREAKERDARRFDAVIIYATSRLSRDLFHALTYEREMTRLGVEVFYALTAGDQTSPEGRLIRHMFQALDQFEVRSSAAGSAAGRPRTPSRASATVVARPTGTASAASRIPTRRGRGPGTRSRGSSATPSRRR